MHNNYLNVPQDGNSVYPKSSLITSKLWSAQVMEAMMTYYKRDHLFNFSYWIVPVHLGAHWEIMINTQNGQEYYPY